MLLCLALALALRLRRSLGEWRRGIGLDSCGHDAGRWTEEGFGNVPTGGGSDDIGDVSWAVPTVTLNFPSNIPGGPGHNWANAISMATPIAHKGVIAGAKVQAMTVLDLLTRPELVEQAWKYFKEVQNKNQHYQPLLRAEDKPAIWLNEKIMQQYRPQMQKFYYDPAKYDNYLQQLGIKYPTVR